MLTPPYHFSIVACPATHLPQDDVTLATATAATAPAPSQILYRGSIPATRNLPFLKRLGLRTVVYCRKKELKADDVLVRWCKKRGAELKWIKAEGMGEEKLGMGKAEIAEVLKVVLSPSSYPLYIADLDGISHTSLVVGCLRKLQGWHAEAIADEISRFEPDYEDLPLMSFINTYLTSSTDTPFVMPAPPYPPWLWPAGRNEQQQQQQPASTKRERTNSSAITAPSPQNSTLPFPHPMTVRKHPTMKLTFPPAASMPPPVQSPQLAAQNPNVTLSRVNSIRGPAIKSPAGGSGSEADHPGLVGAAANLLSNGLSRVASAVGAEDRSKRLSRNVSFENETAYLEWKGLMGAGTTSPEKLSRQPTNISSEEMSEQDVEMVSGAEGTGGEVEELEDEDEDEDEYDDDEEDDEDEDEEDLQPPSQYISALDLAGF